MVMESQLAVIPSSSPALEIPDPSLSQPSLGGSAMGSVNLPPSLSGVEIKVSTLPEPSASQRIHRRLSTVSSIIKSLWNSWDVFWGRKKGMEDQKHQGLAELLSDEAVHLKKRGDGEYNCGTVLFQKHELKRDEKESRPTSTPWRINQGLADLTALYAENGRDVELASPMPEKEIRNTPDTEWHLQDELSISKQEELHNLKLKGTSEIYAKNSNRPESSSQCNSEKERNRELLRERNMNGELLLERNMDVIGKFDNVLGNDQGTGKGGTEAECLTNIDWHLQDELSISEQEELHILKLEGTSEIYANDSGKTESSSECNGGKVRNRELLLQRNMDVIGKFDDVLGSDQGTEAECLTNIVTETHFQDESQNTQLESFDEMYKENGKFEAEKHWLDDKSRDYSSQCRDISNLYAKNEVNVKQTKRMEEENRIGERIKDRMEKDGEIQPKFRNKTAKGESEVTKGKENILEKRLQDELHNLKMEEFDERPAVTNDKVEREKHMPKDKIRRYFCSQIKDINERDKEFPSEMADRGSMNDIFDGNFCRDPRAENGGTEQECVREINNMNIDYDEPSSTNHTNMQQRKPIKEDKLQDSNHRIKSTIKRGNTNSYSERGENKRLSSQGEKQPCGDAEGSASKASKLDFRADRVWSQNQHRNKDDSSVSDKQSENSPSPHINKSQSRHCLVCRSRQAESPQRETTSRKKSRASIPTKIHKGPTSEVHKRDSEYTHSKKLYSTVSDNSSKNSPSSYVIKNQSRCLSRKTDMTRTEPSSQEKPIASATSNDSSSRVCKRDLQYSPSVKADSSVFCKQSNISSNSCAINDQRGFKSKQGRSTQKEPLSREKVLASAESTIGQGSTSGFYKRDSQFGHSEKVESSVNHDLSKTSLTSHFIKDKSRFLSKKKESTLSEPPSHEKSSARATLNDSSSRVGKRDFQYSQSVKADSSVLCNQSKNSSNFCNDQSRIRSKQGRSTQKEPSSQEKIFASAEFTVGQGSTSGFCKRDPQFQHSEKVESSVNHRSKSSLNSHVIEDKSRSKQGSSTPSGSSS